MNKSVPEMGLIFRVAETIAVRLVAMVHAPDALEVLSIQRGHNMLHRKEWKLQLRAILKLNSEGMGTFRPPCSSSKHKSWTRIPGQCCMASRQRSL